MTSAPCRLGGGRDSDVDAVGRGGHSAIDPPEEGASRRKMRLSAPFNRSGEEGRACTNAAGSGSSRLVRFSGV